MLKHKLSRIKSLKFAMNPMKNFFTQAVKQLAVQLAFRNLPIKLLKNRKTSLKPVNPPTKPNRFLAKLTPLWTKNCDNLA